MLKADAEALAAKRNAHKGKSLSHKTWRAVEAAGDWKVVLEDTVPQLASDRLAAAMAVGQAILNNMSPEDRTAFQALAHEALMAKVRRTLGE